MWPSGLLSVSHDLSASRFLLGWILPTHGFRAKGSTILNESERFERDSIELALAHQERDRVRAAYNSALYLSQRGEMLKLWTTYLDSRRAEGVLL